MNRTYVVTGSASGIGLATKLLLVERGHRVIGVDLHDADIEADLSTVEGRERLAIRASELSDGTLDGVIAIAGISTPTSLAVRVNYFGTLATLEGLRPLLARSKSPRAVAVSSFALIYPPDESLLAALTAGDEELAVKVADSISGGSNGGPIYFTTKRAMANWVRREAPLAQWAGQGIALNAVAPGMVVTPLTAATRGDEEKLRAANAAIPMPLNGHAEPVAIARLLAWLTGEENTHLAGQIIFVDGGAEAITRGDVLV